VKTNSRQQSDTGVHVFPVQEHLELETSPPPLQSWQFSVRVMIAPSVWLPTWWADTPAPGEGRPGSGHNRTGPPSNLQIRSAITADLPVLARDSGAAIGAAPFGCLCGLVIHVLSTSLLFRAPDVKDGGLPRTARVWRERSSLLVMASVLPE
jgi:hypothetical protein